MKRGTEREFGSSSAIIGALLTISLTVVLCYAPLSLAERYTLFFLPILFAAEFFGVKAGLATTLLGVILANWLNSYSSDAFSLFHVLLSSTLFGGVGGVASLLVGGQLQPKKNSTRIRSLAFAKEQHPDATTHKVSLDETATDMSSSNQQENLIKSSTKFSKMEEYQRLQDELRKSEERFARLISATSSIVWKATSTGEILPGAHGWGEFTGQLPEEYQGWGWLSAVHHKDREGIRSLWCNALESKNSFETTFRLQKKDGTYHYMHLCAVLIGEVAYDEKEGVQWFGICTDIDERVRAEHELRESEERYRLLAEVSPQLMWESREDGYITYCNKRFLEYTGLTMAEFQGEGWLSVVSPAKSMEIKQSWKAAIDSQEPYRIEVPLCRDEGEEYRWHLIRAIPLRDGKENVIKWLGTAVDIHDTKVAVEQRENLLATERAARSEAERVNRMKDEFLSTLSHELRTPLNAILGWTQLIRQRKLEGEALQDGLQIIERNTRIQVQLIEDLLDMSRIMSGKFTLRVDTVEIKKVITAAIDAVKPAAEAKGITISTLLDSDLQYLSGDPGRLQQVIWNLLTNAVKFTPKEGRITVLLKKTKSSIEISVTDTGKGIKPEFIPHVFERFRQEDAGINRKTGGLGLGLSIVRQLTEMHGGTVSVVSEGEGKGATFSICLPITVVKQQKEDESGYSSPSDLQKLEEEEGISLKGLRVMIVDDEPDARELIRTVLEEREAKVVAAASATEALLLLDKFKPNVLVSDIGMPELDGYQFIKKVRAREKELSTIPAAALTAFARSEDRMRAMLSGFQTHVTKPVEPSELVAVVATLAGRTGGNSKDAR